MRRVAGAFVALVVLGGCVDLPGGDAAPSTSTVAPECSSLPQGVTHTAMTAGGATHAVRIYIPPVQEGTDVLPVVLNWHGLGASGNQQADYTAYEALAEQEGFIAVHPTGSDMPGVPVLEMGLAWELFDELESPERDDIAFANALIDELVANWCADAGRIFSIGMSNGGLLTSTLVCGLADRIAGAGSVVGLFHPASCQPSKAVPYIAFAGITDQVVPFETGGPTIFPELRDSVLALGTFDAFAAFAAQFGCDADPSVSETSADVTRYEYVNCDDDTPMVLYAFDANNGHSWPGAPSDQSTTHEIDATLESWRFFEELP